MDKPRCSKCGGPACWLAEGVAVCERDCQSKADPRDEASSDDLAPAPHPLALGDALDQLEPGASGARPGEAVSAQPEPTACEAKRLDWTDAREKEGEFS